MVTYCYRHGDRVFEWQAPMGKAPQALFANGRIAVRDIVAEHSSVRGGDPWVNHTSLALMVHPLDIKAYEKDAHEKGLTVKFRETGEPEFRSSAEQRDYCRAYDVVNHDANWSAKDQ